MSKKPILQGEQMKKLHKIILLFSFMGTIAHSACAVYSCNDTIEYAMQRYTGKTIGRVGDFEKTIKMTKESEKLYSELLLTEQRELAKLLARVSLENLYIAELKERSAKQTNP